jgi:hypothetical protein
MYESGGLAIGLSTKDMVGNFLGGLLLLINEPFTPGVSRLSVVDFDRVDCDCIRL